jgi:hypothetical protein
MGAYKENFTIREYMKRDAPFFGGELMAGEIFVLDTQVGYF